jgi:hypothetical protein
VVYGKGNRQRNHDFETSLPMEDTARDNRSTSYMIKSAPLPFISSLGIVDLPDVRIDCKAVYI